MVYKNRETRIRVIPACFSQLNSSMDIILGNSMICGTGTNFEGSREGCCEIEKRWTTATYDPERDTSRKGSGEGMKSDTWLPETGFRPCRLTGLVGHCSRSSQETGFWSMMTGLVSNFTPEQANLFVFLPSHYLEILHEVCATYWLQNSPCRFYSVPRHQQTRAYR